jgi:branched-chain amino acid transport system substrate-binding protein
MGLRDVAGGSARRQAFAGLFMAVALAPIAVAGCGSSDSKQDTATSAAAKPSGAPIKVADLSDSTRPDGIGFPEIPAAARARVDAINAAGGIKGRPVELVVCDSKGDPNAGRACARKVVSAGVVAVVGSSTSADATVFPILEKAGVPVVGTTPTSAVNGESDVSFCFNPGVVGAFFAPPAALKAQGAKKVSMIYPSNLGPASALAKTSFEQGVKKTGLQSGVVAGFNSGDSQFDAQVSKATADGVDGVFAFATGENLAPLIKAVRQQAPDVKVATLTASLTPQVIEALGPAADGVAAVAFTQPATATQLPGIKQFNQDLDKYADGDVRRNDRSVSAWASVRAFEQIAAGLPEITRQSVMQAMQHLDGLETGGIYQPLSSSNRGAAKIPGLGCALNTSVVLTEVKDGELVGLEPGKFYDPFAA